MGKTGTADEQVISSGDRAVLRDLAKRVAGIAAEPGSLASASTRRRISGAASGSQTTSTSSASSSGRKMLDSS